MKFAVLLMVGLCSTLLPAAKGLKCHWNKYDNPKGMKEITCEEKSTGKYLKGLQAKHNGDGKMNIGSAVVNYVVPLQNNETDTQEGSTLNPPTIDIFSPIVTNSTESNDQKLTYHCYSATMKDNKTQVDRGCKSNKKTDDCIIGVSSSKFDCMICDNDLCNSGAFIVLSLQAGLVSVAILAKLFFQAI